MSKPKGSRSKKPETEEDKSSKQPVAEDVKVCEGMKLVIMSSALQEKKKKKQQKKTTKEKNGYGGLNDDDDTTSVVTTDASMCCVYDAEDMASGSLLLKKPDGNMTSMLHTSSDDDEESEWENDCPDRLFHWKDEQKDKLDDIFSQRKAQAVVREISLSKDDDEDETNGGNSAESVISGASSRVMKRSHSDRSLGFLRRTATLETQETDNQSLSFRRQLTSDTGRVRRSISARSLLQNHHDDSSESESDEGKGGGHRQALLLQSRKQRSSRRNLLGRNNSSQALDQFIKRSNSSKNLMNDRTTTTVESSKLSERISPTGLPQTKDDSSTLEDDVSNDGGNRQALLLQRNSRRNLLGRTHSSQGLDQFFKRSDSSKNLMNDRTMTTAASSKLSGSISANVLLQQKDDSGDLEGDHSNDGENRQALLLQSHKQRSSCRNLLDRTDSSQGLDQFFKRSNSSKDLITDRTVATSASGKRAHVSSLYKRTSSGQGLQRMGSKHSSAGSVASCQTTMRKSASAQRLRSFENHNDTLMMKKSHSAQRIPRSFRSAENMKEIKRRHSGQALSLNASWTGTTPPSSTSTKKRSLRRIKSGEEMIQPDCVVRGDRSSRSRRSSLGRASMSSSNSKGDDNKSSRTRTSKQREESKHRRSSSRRRVGSKNDELKRNSSHSRLSKSSSNSSINQLSDQEVNPKGPTLRRSRTPEHDVSPRLRRTISGRTFGSRRGPGLKRSDTGDVSDRLLGRGECGRSAGQNKGPELRRVHTANDVACLISTRADSEKKLDKENWGSGFKCVGSGRRVNQEDTIPAAGKLSLSSSNTNMSREESSRDGLRRHSSSDKLGCEVLFGDGVKKSDSNSSMLGQVEFTDNGSLAKSSSSNRNLKTDVSTRGVRRSSSGRGLNRIGSSRKVHKEESLQGFTRSAASKNMNKEGSTRSVRRASSGRSISQEDLCHGLTQVGSDRKINQEECTGLGRPSSSRNMNKEGSTCSVRRASSGRSISREDLGQGLNRVGSRHKVRQEHSSRGSNSVASRATSSSASRRLRQEDLGRGLKRVGSGRNVGLKGSGSSVAGSTGDLRAMLKNHQGRGLHRCNSGSNLLQRSGSRRRICTDNVSVARISEKFWGADRSAPKGSDVTCSGNSEKAVQDNAGQDIHREETAISSDGDQAHPKGDEKEIKPGEEPEQRSPVTSNEEIVQNEAEKTGVGDSEQQPQTNLFGQVVDKETETNDVCAQSHPTETDDSTKKEAGNEDGCKKQPSADNIDDALEKASNSADDDHQQSIPAAHTNEVARNETEEAANGDGERQSTNVSEKLSQTEHYKGQTCEQSDQSTINDGGKVEEPKRGSSSKPKGKAESKASGRKDKASSGGSVRRVKSEQGLIDMDDSDKAAKSSGTRVARSGSNPTFKRYGTRSKSTRGSRSAGGESSRRSSKRSSHRSSTNDGSKDETKSLSKRKEALQHLSDGADPKPPADRSRRSSSRSKIGSDQRSSSRRSKRSSVESSGKRRSKRDSHNEGAKESTTPGVCGGEQPSTRSHDSKRSTEKNDTSKSERLAELRLKWKDATDLVDTSSPGEGYLQQQQKGSAALLTSS